MDGSYLKKYFISEFPGIINKARVSYYSAGLNEGNTVHNFKVLIYTVLPEHFSQKSRLLGPKIKIFDT